MNKRISLTLATGIFFLLAGAVRAADLNLVCTASGCSPATTTAIFPAADRWYPGKSVTKIIGITNNSPDAILISQTAQNASASGGLDGILTVSISSSRMVPVWTGTLANFLAAGNIFLGDLPAGAGDDFSYTIFLPASAGNNYQNKIVTFDLRLNFSAAPAGEFVPPVLGEQERISTGVATTAGVLGIPGRQGRQNYWWLIFLIGGGLTGFLIWHRFFGRRKVLP